MENYYLVYIIAGVMFLIGLLVTVTGVRRVKRCTEPAQATIVDIEVEVESSDDGKEQRYRPVFEFAAKGENVRKKGNVSSSRRRAYHVGDVKNVRYNPDKPKEFIVEGSGSGAGAGIFLMILAVAVAAVVFYFTTFK